MRRRTALKLLVTGLALLIGLGSGYQFLRNPSRLRAALVVDGGAESMFAPDGKTLVTEEWSEATGTTIRVWDVAEGRERAALPINSTKILLEISPHGRFVARLDGVDLKVWDTIRGTRWAVPWDTGQATYHELAIRFSEDSRLLAVDVPFPPKCSVFDAETGEELANFKARLRSLAFAPDSLTVICANSDFPTGISVLTTWDVKTRRKRTEQNAHRDTISCVALSPDAKTIASATRCEEDGKSEMKLSDAVTMAQRTVFLSDFQGVSVTSLLFSPDGRLLVAGDGAQTTLWDITSQHPKKVAAFATVPAFSRDGTLIVIVDESKAV